MRIRALVRLTGFLIALTGSGAQAAVYEAPVENNDLIGDITTIHSQYEDTFVDIGRRHDLGYRELNLANPKVDPWLPGQGTRIVLPTRYILPNAPRKGIVVNLVEMRVYYYPPADSRYAGKVITYPIGIGREGWGTPLGR
ncbi:MAG: L,D-transpeptidase, partial [Salinisphaera sp.]|nr:L,D-transpeptidase [Salinisphaera sp.]